MNSIYFLHPYTSFFYFITTNTFVAFYSFKSLIASHLFLIKKEIIYKALYHLAPAYIPSLFSPFLLHLHDPVSLYWPFSGSQTNLFPPPGLQLPLLGKLVPQLFMWLVHAHLSGLSSDIPGTTSSERSVLTILPKVASSRYFLSHPSPIFVSQSVLLIFVYLFIICLFHRTCWLLEARGLVCL